MQTRELPDTETCWALLERIASSAPLKRAARLQELLFYIGKRSLKDGSDRVHEQEIGTHVFRRPDSYDTSVDNIVRTNVSDLRKRIETYFHTEGLNEPLIMEIPRGSYIPVFRYRAETAKSTAETPTTPPEPVTELKPQPAETPFARPNQAWMPFALTMAAVLVLALTATSIYFWNQYHALHQSMYEWQSKPAVQELWSRFFNANPNTDVVISDTGIGLAQAVSQKQFTLNDYLSRNYISQLQSAQMSPDRRAALNRILAWNLGNPDEFTLARRLLALDPQGNNMHFYNARNYVPDLVKRDNVILIGARKSNPWDELFDNRMNFITEFDSPHVINRAPVNGEPATYVPLGADGYGIVAFMPNEDNSGAVFLIEGTNAEATEAAGDFLLSNDQLSNFKNMLHVAKLPYFQVLLKVSAVRGTPLSTSIEAYRVYTQAH